MELDYELCSLLSAFSKNIYKFKYIKVNLVYVCYTYHVRLLHITFDQLLPIRNAGYLLSYHTTVELSNRLFYFICKIRFALFELIDKHSVSLYNVIQLLVGNVNFPNLKL